MKKYFILESWHNGTSNGTDETYAICYNESDAKEVVQGVLSSFLHLNTLGEDFPDPDGKNWMHQSVDSTTKTYYAWIGPTGCGFLSSEHRRSFRIVEMVV